MVSNEAVHDAGFRFILFPVGLDSLLLLFAYWALAQITSWQQSTSPPA